MHGLSKILCFLSALLLGHDTLAAAPGSLLLSGYAPYINSIFITPFGSHYNNLDILRGEISLNVAAVYETSNDASGYEVFLSSANGGHLVNSLDGSKNTTYTLSYNGNAYAAPPLNASPVIVKSVNALGGLTTNVSQVNINVTAFPNATNGIYSDTVTISIVGF